MIGQYLEEISRTFSGKTVADYRERLARFEAWMTANDLTEYNRATVVAFIYAMQKERMGPASISLHKHTISAFFSWLQENEHLSRNPIKRLALGSYTAKKRPDNFAFTAEEYGILKAETSNLKRHKFWHGAVIVGWNTSLRLGDIANLRRASIILSQKRIALVPQKTIRLEKTVEIPILPELFDWFSGQTFDCEWIFPEMHATYMEDGARQLSNQFHRICVKAGLTGKSFHSLRHSFVTRALCNGISAPILSSITGHSIQTMNRYVHVPFDVKTDKMMEALA